MRRIIAVAATLLTATVANAQDNIHPSMNSKYWIDIGGYYPEHKVTLSVEGSNQDIDEEFEFEGAVDLADRKALLNGEFGWQFGEKWSLNLQYFETERSRDILLDEEIHWEDHVFEVGADVTAGTYASVTRIYFSRKVLKPGRHDLRLGAGFHRMSVGASIEGTARLNDMTTEVRSDNVSAKAPLPNIGAWYRYSPSDRWMFTLRADWFGASFGEISGELIDLMAGVNFRLFENVGIGLNYQRLSLNGRIDAENWTGEIDVIYNGPQILISGFW